MYYTYILSNKSNSVLYVGFTKDLVLRVFQHKTAKIKTSFTARYNVNKLVWFREHQERADSFNEEQRIKRWRRAWKNELIESDNPNWKDLASDWDFIALL